MAPCVKEPPRERYYILRFKDGVAKSIRADEISKMTDRPAIITLTRGDDVVAEYAAEDVSGWCMEEVGTQ